MYKNFISRAEYDRIVQSYPEAYGSRSPHCDPSVRHRPSHCAFCDGFYLANPEEREVMATFIGITGEDWTPDIANGWGGNVAPVVDDDKAAEEDAAWMRVASIVCSCHVDGGCVDIGHEEHHGGCPGEW